ncbi:UPF0158 family protein [Paenibacillus sp. P36]|uniref:UPF0158 family protein n=1 Tax=Paenibacillus sp. P36 TaxID=3342538 RepID=UPI0038B378C2
MGSKREACVDPNVGWIRAFFNAQCIKEPLQYLIIKEEVDRNILIPKIDSNEAFRVMANFSHSTQSDPNGRLFDALSGNKPFRRFKDMLYELNMWDEWNKYQNQYAEKEIQSWMEESELNFNELDEKYKASQSFYAEDAI